MLYFGAYFILGVLMGLIALVTHPEEFKEITRSDTAPPLFVLGLLLLVMGIAWLPVGINLLLKKRGW
ncbi:hypothetical protein [Bacillus cereus]|uniref:hypothetical protein n=1 Tax=Bacillus cereus group TaxID=86661 RepID=UPI001BA9BFB7|nr:hypothetical protein [Bacillus cereus]MBR9655753.1 hypothetical protein [Bacillus cereus]